MPLMMVLARKDHSGLKSEVELKDILFILPRTPEFDFEIMQLFNNYQTNMPFTP